MIQMRNHFTIIGALALVTASLAADPPDGQPVEEPNPRAAPNPRFSSEALRFVEDDAPVRHAALNRNEALAYDLLFLHAQRLPLDILRKAARRDLTFAHLFGDERAKYRGELVHITGQLRLLRRYELPDTLRDEAAQMTDLYEAWIFIDDYGGNPYCVVVGELPAGMKAAEKIDLPVECDAFFFKRYLYGSRDGKRLAPLLIGRTITPVKETVAGVQSASAIWQVPGTVIATTFGLIGVTVAGGLAVIWWFRRDDQRVRTRLRQARVPAPEFPGDTDHSCDPASVLERGPFSTKPSNN